MLTRWALVRADFRREYSVTTDELARMGFSEFWQLLRGMSDRSRFHRAWSQAPKHMHDPDERAAVIAAARR